MQGVQDDSIYREFIIILPYDWRGVTTPLPLWEGEGGGSFYPLILGGKLNETSFYVRYRMGLSLSLPPIYKRGT